MSLIVLSLQEAPPEKKVVPGPSRPNKQYGGPGSFVPTGEDRTHHPQRSASYGPQPDLYVAPYEQPVQPDPIHTLSQGFGEMNVGRRRRQSAPVSSLSYSFVSSLTYIESMALVLMHLIIRRRVTSVLPEMERKGIRTNTRTLVQLTQEYTEHTAHPLPSLALTKTNHYHRIPQRCEGKGKAYPSHRPASCL